MHFLYLAASIALVRAAALPRIATNNLQKRFGPSSAEVSACINSAAPQYLEKDYLAVRCMCYCGGSGCANVAESEFIDMQYRLNPKIPDSCDTVFHSADAGQTPPIGDGTMYQGSPYETENAENAEDENKDENEDTEATEVRVADAYENWDEYI